MLSRRARLAVPGLALAGITVLTGAAAQGPDSVAAQVRAAEQPQLQAVEAPAAWRLSQGRGVTVAVLDTGVDATAADLACGVTTGPDYTLGADPPGYQPPHLHGTFIASRSSPGTAAGPGDDGGIIGVAPAAQVLSVRVILDDQEPGLGVYNSNPRYADAIDDGIRYATQHGAQVIKMSRWAPATRPGACRAALGYAVVARGAGGGVRRELAAASGPGYTPYSVTRPRSPGWSRSRRWTQACECGCPSPTRTRRWSCPRPGSASSGPAGRQLPAGQRDQPGVGVRGRGGGADRAAYPRPSPAQVAQALISSARRRPAGGYSPSTGSGEVDAVAALHAAGRLAAARPAPGWRPAALRDRARPGRGHRPRPGAIAALAGVGRRAPPGRHRAVAPTLLTARTARDRRRQAAVGPAVRRHGTRRGAASMRTWG